MIENYDQLINDSARAAVIDLLYRMADDELILGHRDSEWTGHAPILEGDIAFSSIAQDEIGHAHVYYQMLHELGEADPDTLAFGREPEHYRCSSLVVLPKDDWAFTLVRQFFFDSAESIRLAALCDSSFVPLAQLARKLRGEEKYHLMHGQSWMLRMGRGTGESRKRMEAAIALAYPHALGLFEPTQADGVLAELGIHPRESEIQAKWKEAVHPILSDARLSIPERAKPVYGGRQGKHDAALTELLDQMQSVYQLDPAAKW